MRTHAIICEHMFYHEHVFASSGWETRPLHLEICDRVSEIGCPLDELLELSNFVGVDALRESTSCATRAPDAIE